MVENSPSETVGMTQAEAHRLLALPPPAPACTHAPPPMADEALAAALALADTPMVDARPCAEEGGNADLYAAHQVIAMARLLTEGEEAHFCALIDNTPGSWSAIAEAIAPYTPEDARFARRHIRDTLVLRLERNEDSPEFQEVLAYLFENRTLPEMLAQAHQWRCEPHRGRALFKDESRAANLEVLIRLNRQHNSQHGLS